MPRRLRRARPLLEGVARGQFRREVRGLLKEPTVPRWLNLCDLPVTSSHAFWQAVRAVDPTYPDHSPLENPDGSEPWTRVPDSFTFARALDWARRQRLVEAHQEKRKRRPR